MQKRIKSTETPLGDVVKMKNIEKDITHIQGI